MTNLLKIIKESGINFSGSLIGMVLSYVLLIIITHFLTPDEYGIFVLAQSIINFSLMFVLFGTPSSLNRYIPIYNASGEYGKTKTLIYGILKISALLCVIVSSILFATSGLLSQSIFKNSDLELLLKVMVLSVPLLAYIQQISFTFIGFKELRYQVYIQRLILPISKIVLGLLVFTIGYGLIVWTWMYLLSLFLSSIIAFRFFRRHISPTLSKFKKIPICFGEIISYSWPLSINSIILIFLGQIDFLFLGYFRSPAEIGAYRIYIYLVASLGLTLSSFAQIYKPVISELISQKGFKEVRETYRRVSKWVFLINSLALLVLLIFGTTIVRTLFGEGYLIAPVALSILAAGRFLNSAFGPEGMTLEAFGDTRLSMLNSLIMLGTNVCLNYLLIPQYGIIGAAIATSSSITVGGLAGLVEIYFLHHLQPYGFQYMKYITVTLVSGGITYAITRELVTLEIVELLTLIVMLSALYFIGLYYSNCLDGTDYKILGQIKSRITNGKRIR